MARTYPSTFKIRSMKKSDLGRGRRQPRAGRWAACAGAAILCASGHATQGLKPEGVPFPAAIVAPVDRPYGGVLKAAVDITDRQRRVVHVHESLPALDGADLVLLYPEWLPGWHAPGGRL